MDSSAPPPIRRRRQTARRGHSEIVDESDGHSRPHLVPPQEPFAEIQTRAKSAITKLSPRQTPSVQIAEALKMQMEVQRKLEQQMEVQRHLQLRIEAQGRYLQSVLNKAKATHLLHSASDNSSLTSSDTSQHKTTKTIDLNLNEFDSGPTTGINLNHFASTF
ncbi:myb family transcription factor PHL7-like isoform X4 [Salvia miltiorrhiza]|uniref:myb family transcription factor PHL7-like isoform X4 n=1 Tax=Salvia miltiorrhiza TaxID=226208 RepID=UPI0025AC7C0E|nr:myb family transcription factor PHL7-like isoform X4 [Salvia miltiorrhiza]